MIDNITLWHKRARPEPMVRDLDVQIGCHIEEFIEMMDSLNIDANSDLARALDDLEEFADALKAGVKTVSSIDREPLLDSLADQIVTAVGVGVCAKMDMNAAVLRLTRVTGLSSITRATLSSMRTVRLRRVSIIVSLI